MKVNTKPYKGARDFYPEDKQRQNWLFDQWRSVVESYGYEEYDAPILEPTDLYLMKGNEEIVKEQTYTFKDRGDRSVTIRTEMTPTVSRMIAGRRQELAYPVRWYSIPNLWRYERMQRGRLREFWQLNVDIFGVSSIAAEVEMIQVTDDLFRAFGAKRSSYTIKVNSRVLVNTMFKFLCGMNDAQSVEMINLTDRMTKMSTAEFKAAVTKITKDSAKTTKIIKLLCTKSVQDLPEELLKSPSATELTELLQKCSALGISNVEFDISLMRGFDYYTDIVFEVFDNSKENSRALMGGGRYDGLVSQFGVDSVPTVGFGLGDVVFMDFLETHKLLPDLAKAVETIILLKEEAAMGAAVRVASELRDANLNIAVDYSLSKFDKQYKSAKKAGYKYAIYVEQNSQAEEKYVLKYLESGKEESHTVERIAKIVGK